MSIGESGRDVTERTASGTTGRLQAWVARMLRLPFECLAAGAEVPVSRRGVPLLFLAFAVVLATAGWLRPPLSPDIRGIHLPLRIETTEGTTPEGLLHVIHPLGTH